MANYTHVQFISWEIYTGPNRGPQPWAMGKDGIGYTGIGKENAPDNRLDIEGQLLDIEERVVFTRRAILEAHALAVKHPTTLKVFMAPEFLYRGKGGAYIHDLINGWEGPPPDEFNLRGYERFPGLFGLLQGWASSPTSAASGRIEAGPVEGKGQYEHWLFVFGTAISASFPARSETNKGWVIDSTQMGEIYNTALIQLGGQRGEWGNVISLDAYASRKRYIASIDFIKSQYKAKGFTGGPGGDVVEADRLDLEPNESAREGSATFTIDGINDKAGQPIMFGLEVCLDHSISTPRNPQPPLWANSTVYAIGKGVISPDNGWVYTCGIAHTSSASPTTFTQDNNNNRGRWVMPPLWANSTVYAIGNVVFSPDELYTCGIAHTSSASPTTFTQDNNNNPGRWIPYPHRNRWGRIRTADKWVKIQLVPSGGMHLTPASIRLLPAAGPTPHSYAFHCDGLTTLNSNLVAWGAQTTQEWGAHTQIWNGANGTVPVPRENQLINANYRQKVENTQIAEVGDNLDWLGGGRRPRGTIYASNLWDLGAGCVRVMQEMPL